MDDSGKITSLLEESGAMRHGHFLLSSGLHSETYVQCALLLQSPERAQYLGSVLASRLKGYRPDSVLSPALGGLIIGYEVASSLGVPFRFTERKDGVMSLRRGFALQRDERVVLIEDVITTGLSLQETAAVATAHGAEVLAGGSLIDRSSATETLGMLLISLLELRLESFVPEDCPRCQRGESLDQPGSRTGILSSP